MTAQISDSFQLEPAAPPFSVVRVSGEALFEPKEHRLNPVVLHTACYRGWYATYGLRSGQLELNQLTIGLDYKAKLEARRGRVVQLAGVSPRSDPSCPGQWLYEGLGLPLLFSGGVLVGRAFLRELRVHMGFHPAWKFREVFELVFERGQIISRVDKSKEMAGVRSRF